MSRSNYIKEYSLDDVIPFGKHSGRTIKDVMWSSPQYLLWAHHMVPFFNLKDCVLRRLKREMEELRDTYYDYLNDQSNWWK